MDINRGLEIRKHPSTGAEIYMVIGNKELGVPPEPGVYYNINDLPVSEDMAAEAGFPVEQHRKAREKAAALAKASAVIEAQYAGVEAKNEVIAERRGYKLLDIGMDRYAVLDPDGTNLTPKYISPAIAQHVFDQLVPPEEPAEEG